MTNPLALQVWHQQVDAALEDVELALKRREPLTLVLRADSNGDVQPAKLTKTLQEEQKTERIKTWPLKR